MFRALQGWAVAKPNSTTKGTLAGIACAFGSAAYLIPQPLFLDKCVEIFQLHKHGIPVKLPDSLEDEGKQVLEQLELTPKQKEAVHFFNVTGFDVIHLGSTSTAKGAAIGIPMSFSFKSEKDVERNDIHVDHKTFSWSSQAGQDLKKSLVLSENAKKFAIAREIYEASYPKLHIHGIGTGILMGLTFHLAFWGNARFNLWKRPFKTRALWYGLTFFCGWALWITLTDLSNVTLQKMCDQLVVNLGKDYVNGGVEYYQKKMQQNRALKVLMGAKGDKYYTTHGNYNALLRSKSVPLSQQLDNMKRLQKEFVGTEELET